MTVRNQNFDRANQCPIGRPKISIRHCAKTEPVTSSEDAIEPIRKFCRDIFSWISFNPISTPGPPQSMTCKCLARRYFKPSNTNFQSVGKFGCQTKAEFQNWWQNLETKSTTRDQLDVLTISEEHKTKQKATKQSRVELKREVSTYSNFQGSFVGFHLVSWPWVLVFKPLSFIHFTWCFV